MMKKIIPFLLSMLLSLTCFGTLGCSGQEKENFDSGNSHLYVGVFNAGYGIEWLKDVKDRFEEFYKNEKFEESKVGVQVHITDVAAGNAFVDQFEGSPQEVIFTANTDYYQYIRKNILLDLTDVVTTEPTEYGESKSIESRMFDSQKEFFKNSDGKYYGLSYGSGYYGITYNVDMFENKEFYFAKGGCPSEYLRTNPNCDTALSGKWNDTMWEFTGTGEKSAGPDGKYGTNDDGEPATYEEFFKLCDQCSDSAVQSIHWSGKNQPYISKTMLSMMTDYMGAYEMGLNFSCNGISKTLVSVDNQGVVTPLDDVNITSSNGYELFKQEGKYQVLNFIDTLLKNKNYYNENTSVYNLSHTHTDAQEDFISGGIMSGKNEIAMLFEGTWWMNEAKPAFKALSEGKGSQYSMENRRFKMMAFPKGNNDKVGEPFTMYETDPYICMAKKNISSEKQDIAKKFIKFAFTNKSNLRFTETTMATRYIKYDLPSGWVDTLPYFAQQNVLTQKDAEYCFSGSTSLLSKNYSFQLFNSESILSAYIDGATQSVPATVLAKNTNVSAIDYFNGMIEFHDKAYWDRNYSTIYNK